MSGNSKNNFAGIEVAMTTMRGVVISEAGETIASRDAIYEPENLISAIADLYCRTCAKPGISTPSASRFRGWSIAKRIAC